MAAFLRLLALCLLLSITLPAAADDKIGKDYFDAQKEILQLKIDNGREFVQKDLDSLKTRIDGLDERIDDQNNRVGDVGQSVDRFAVIVSVLGILVTVLLAAGGLVGYFSVTRKAAEEAKSASQKWFNDNQQELATRILELEKASEQAIQKIDNSVNDVEQHSNAAIEQIQAGLNAPNQQAESISPIEQQALQQSAEQIRGKPEASYSFEDWNKRAFDAYRSGQYEDAAQYWKQASSIPNAGATNTAQTLFNRAVALSHLKRYDEACTTYEQLIATYSPDNTPAIREQVARAILNMGVALRQMQKPAEAIATYEQLIANYSSDNTPAIREQVANAFNSKGYVRLVEAKKVWEDSVRAFTLLREAQTDLLAGLDRRADCGMTRGNLAYVQWLIGDRPAAEESFRAALTSAHFGGEKLYHATLEDIAQHMVQEDDAFRAMVERLWAEYQAAKSGGD